MGGGSSPCHGELGLEEWSEESSEEEEEGKEVEEEEEEEGGRWLKHYSSRQEILLVGEGDFSFSLSLATAFREAFNITATSLDSYEVVGAKYAKALCNLKTLEKMGATLLHGVDATKMKLHTDLKMRKFDRIIFNFPHVGFKGREDQMRLINLHRKLVQGFFRNASHMLRQNGEIHVSHKTGLPFCSWNLEELASKNSLILKECVDFKIEDYPGYNNKRGDGARCDESFPLGNCCTYMFIIGDVHKKKKASAYEMGFTSGVSLPVGGKRNDSIRISIRNILHPADGCKPIEHMLNVDSMQRRVYSPPKVGIATAPLKVFESQLGGDCSLFDCIRGSMLNSSREAGYPPTRIGTGSLPLSSVYGSCLRHNYSSLESIQRSVHSLPRFEMSTPTTIFEHQLEDYYKLSVGIHRRAYYPPRIGISNAPMGAFEPERIVYSSSCTGVGSLPVRAFETNSVDEFHLFRRHRPESINLGEECLKTHYQEYMNEATSKNTLGYFARQAQEFQDRSNSRFERLPGMPLVQTGETNAAPCREMVRLFGQCVTKNII